MLSYGWKKLVRGGPMLYGGSHEVPEVIDCSEIVRQGGRVEGGIIAQCELEGDEEIRVSIRSSKLPSIELFTIRNVKPGDYRLVLAMIPRERAAERPATA